MMKIAFFSNFINHHQALLSDELYKLTKRNYYFISLEPMPASFVARGYPSFDDRPYLIKAYENELSNKRAIEIAIESDVAIFGASSIKYLVLRSRKTDKISFEVSERWLKRGWINLFSPNLLKNQWFYHTLFYKKPVYKLCSSAFAAVDQRRLFSYKNRCFKWGYFTVVDDMFELDGSRLDESNSESTTLMWCARFLNWKHPELPIQLAARLKRKGYNFILDMFGDGEKYGEIENLIETLEVRDCVRLYGNRPNSEILQEMRKHKIFLFTSDRNEGWGAVLNEAMANGCVPVASNEIGSVPYLIKDKINGLVFKSCNLDSLEQSVCFLLDNPKKIMSMSEAALHTMQEVWSPKNAANSLIQLANDLVKNGNSSITEGPCSKA